MAFLNHPKYRYIVLLPVFVLIINSIFFKYVLRNYEENMVKEKYIEVMNSIKVLEATTEADPTRPWLEHEKSIIAAVEYIDKQHQIYAEAYKFENGKFKLITGRNYTNLIPFNPFGYSNLMDAIYLQEEGEVDVVFDPDGSSPRILYLYFNKMPSYSLYSEKYLVIAGVSKYSIINTLSLWIFGGYWTNVLITFGMNVFLVALIVLLGHIYDRRIGSKWRANMSKGEDNV